MSIRFSQISRKTTETDISLELVLDGNGISEISTGIGFFDHMLEQLSRHSLIDIKLKAQGDLHIDFHHTVEDTGIALGVALSQALGERKGITRFACCHLPMDEALTRASIDISGRPYLHWNVGFKSPKIGEMDSELFVEFFRAFAFNAGITLHIENLYGDNAHHIAESSFKAVARALREAIKIDKAQETRIPSTKGTLNG